MKVEQLNQSEKKVSKQEQQEYQEYIELDIDSLIKLGVVERDFEIAGIKFTMRTLTEEERMLAEQEVNDGLSPDDIRHLMNLKIPYLSRSITKINGKPVVDRNKLASVLMKMQSAILDSLYLKYTELVKDQMSLIEAGAKKNG